MKRKILLLLSVVLFVGMSASAKVYIKYVNLDQSSYIFDVMIGGKKTKVEFGSNRTTSVMIKGSETNCTILTPCGEVSISNGSKIVIEDGCIKLD